MRIFDTPLRSWNLTGYELYLRWDGALQRQTPDGWTAPRHVAVRARFRPSDRPTTSTVDKPGLPLSISLAIAQAHLPNSKSAGCAALRSFISTNAGRNPSGGLETLPFFREKVTELQDYPCCRWFFKLDRYPSKRPSRRKMNNQTCDSVLASESKWKLLSWKLFHKLFQKPQDTTKCQCCAPPSAPSLTKQELQPSVFSHESGEETHSSTSHDEDEDYTDEEEVERDNNDHPLAPTMLEQSPIDICKVQYNLIRDTNVLDRVRISTTRSDAELHYSAQGFSVHWNAPVSNTLTINGKVYTAVQFHFHTPSEHTLNGDHEAMELHLVHKAADGSLAVIGVFFREGNENPFLAQFWDELAMLQLGQAATVPLGEVDVAPLKILDGSIYRYRGSLTTPPYTEGVEWILLQDIAEASREQLEGFRNVLPKPNARPVQPLNKRDVSLVL